MAVSLIQNSVMVMSLFTIVITYILKIPQAATMVHAYSLYSKD